MEKLENIKLTSSVKKPIIVNRTTLSESAEKAIWASQIILHILNAERPKYVYEPSLR